jgi:large subunit ribosomal protein L16
MQFSHLEAVPEMIMLNFQGQGQRMGGGKGSIDHYVTPVKARRVILEMGGKCEFIEVSDLLNCYVLVTYFQ